MNMLNYIVWNPNPIIFSIGNFELRWYSVLWVIGLLGAYVEDSTSGLSYP